MTKRLQVLMDDDELRSIQKLAKQDRVTTAEWVRQRLREARDRDTTPSTAAKLAAIRTAARYRFPVPDIDQLLEEIVRGQLSNSPDLPEP